LKWTPELNLLDEPGLKCIDGLSNDQDNWAKGRGDPAGPDAQEMRLSTAGSEAGATAARRWRNDLVGGEMPQQRSEAMA
jgi:hypothetical protein